MTAPTLPPVGVPAETLDRTRPGSGGRAILCAFGRASVAAAASGAGIGATIAEARAACSERDGAIPAAFTATAYSLVERGVLERCGGRPGHTRFAPARSREAPAGAPTVPLVDSLDASSRATVATHTARVGAGLRDYGERVLAALRWLTDAEARWYTTREVRLALDACGLRLDAASPNAVRKRLESLCQRHVRGAADWIEPRVERRTEMTATGKPSAMWRLLPAGEATADPEQGSDVTRAVPCAPRSDAEAIRIAVRAAEAELGRVVGATELRWWAEARTARHVLTPPEVRGEPAEEERVWRAAQHLVAGHVGRMLAFVRAADLPYDGAPGRLVVCAADHACHGGAPRRYRVGSDDTSDAATKPLASGLALARLQDALVGLQPVRELRDIAALQQAARHRQLDALEVFAQRRLAALAAVLTAAAAPLEPEDALERVVHVLRTLTDWSQHTASSEAREWRRRPLADLLAACGAARQVLHATARQHREESLRTVGTAALTTLGEVRPLAVFIGRGHGLSAHGAIRLVQGARRFPATGRPARKAFTTGSAPAALSSVDRVDAMMALYGATRALSASTRALLRGAVTLLGRVVRDAAALRTLRDALPPGETPMRHAATVALALLGEVPQLRDVITRWDSTDDLTAYLVSLGASAATDAGVLDALDALDRQPRVASPQAIAVARRCASMGQRLAMI